LARRPSGSIRLVIQCRSKAIPRDLVAVCEKK
jgi:hypothetical protein